jgi:hypothetical protein
LTVPVTVPVVSCALADSAVVHNTNSAIAQISRPRIRFMKILLLIPIVIERTMAATVAAQGNPPEHRDRWQSVVETAGCMRSQPFTANCKSGVV